VKFDAPLVRQAALTAYKRGLRHALRIANESRHSSHQPFYPAWSFDLQDAFEGVLA
jgi:hypothetical protein